MKIWIVSILILIAGIAAVWVVIGALFSNPGEESPFTIPKGRYDTFMITSNGFVKTDHFPPTAGAMPGPFPRPAKAMYEDTRDYFDMKFTIGADAKDPTMAKLCVEDAFRCLDRIDEIANLKREGSEISRINRDAANKPVKLSDELYFVIKRAQEISERSGGAFDVTIAPIRQMWEQCAERGELPTSDDMVEARAVVGYKLLEIDDKKRTIHFKKKGMILDLRDIIGGFAMDQVVYALKAHAAQNGWVRMGDSYRFIPSVEDEQQYGRLGVPGGRGELKFTYTVDRPAVILKGNYTGYKFVGSTLVTDLIDPHTGTCIGGIGSCTVVGPDAMSCDAMATALCVFSGNTGRVYSFLGEFNPKETGEQPKAPAKTEE